MKKYSLDVWLSGSKECFGLFDSEEVALEEGRILECSLGKVRISGEILLG